MPRDPWQQGISGPPRIPGRRAAWFGRVFGQGENPLRWGLPLGRVLGVRVRIHWLFLLYIVAGVVFTLPRHQAGLVFELPWLGALLVLVLLHDLGHCLACRWVGGEADEVVLWPLGGLAPCRPPHNWRAELWTTLGGPLVNAALLPLLVGALFWGTGSWSVAVPNPFALDAARLGLQRPDGSTPWWLIGLWSFHSANILLLLLNSAVPMHPLDGGRILQCLVWRTHGYHRSRWVVAHVGLGAAVVLGAAGLALSDGKGLLILGVFGALACWHERRRIEFLAGHDPSLDTPTAPSPLHPGNHPDAGEVGGVEGSGLGQADLDRILEKISRVGLGGLTGAERRALKRATERSRESQGRSDQSKD